MNEKLKKGVQDAFYYVSFDCFEKICMSSKSKMGNSVRDYFVTLRKFIEYYREHISEMIIDKAIEGKAVYILLVNKGKSIFKPGQTSKSMRKRLYAYATGKDTHPDIRFIMLADKPKEIEKCTKMMIEKTKLRGNQELYKIDLNILKTVMMECAGLKDFFNNLIEKDNLEKTKYNVHIIFDDTKIIEYLDLDNNVIGMEKPHKYVKNKKSKSNSKK